MDTLPFGRAPAVWNWKSLVGAAAWLLWVASHAFAHHSFAAEFDATTPLTLRGAIAKVEWVNPHCLLWMDVRGATGTLERWGLELPPPNALFRRGIRHAMLQPGETISAAVYPAKDGRTFAIGLWLVGPDGQTLVLGPPGTIVPGAVEGKK